MSRLIPIATLLLALTVTLAACAGPAAQANAPAASATAAATSAPTAAPTAAPTSTPKPTAVPLIASNVYVAGVHIGELTIEQARAKLEQELAPKLRSLDVQAGEAQLTIHPEDIDLRLALEEMLAEAEQAEAGARVALQVSYDEASLRSALEGLAQQLDTPPEIMVITSTESISRSFAMNGGQTLDIDAAVQALDKRLQSLSGARRVTLSTRPAPGAARPTPEQLQQQIAEMAAEWNGVVGVYVYDLASDSVVASLNENTVFSGASVMKVPILLQSYVTLPSFSAKQETWLKKMIVESDNLAANQLLAASANGSGTEDALQGALNMTDMLHGLGLEHTYQYMPYEASDYLIKVRGFKIKRGPAQEGPEPYTEADPVLRTTPAEMSRVFLLIHQCSQGQGPLLEKFGDSLTAARCQEMLDRLEQNGDRKRMVAGFPAGTAAAHKSGWIEDMQADVGLVRSPGGDFLLAVYIYRDIGPKKIYLDDRVAMPVIASFARAVYTYYNPVAVGD